MNSILYKDPLELCLISQGESNVESEEVKFLKSLFEMNVEEVHGVDSRTQKF